MWKVSYTGNKLNPTGLPSLSRRSCTACQGQKRQCDRLLPQCTRCRKYGTNIKCKLHKSASGLTSNRRGNSCHYDDLYIEEESCHQQRYRSLGVQPRSMNIASLVQSALPLQNSASNKAVSQPWLGSGSMEQQVMDMVLGVLSSLSTSLHGIVERSRRNISSWLPIIDIQELTWKTEQLQQEPSADVAVLLLAMHLMNELSMSPALEHDRHSVPLLELCRTLFLELFQKRTASLETLQAGIILSALQLDAGQMNDASLTISLCANLGTRLSLNQLPVAETGIYSRLCIKKRNIWYAIIMLDRYISSHALTKSLILTMNGRVISVADPYSCTAVAITDESLGSRFAQTLSLNSSQSSDHEERYDGFIFQTRAAYILGQVCSFVRAQSTYCGGCLEAKYWDFDYTLRMMGIAAVKKSSQVGRNLPCVASPLIFMLVFLVITICISRLTPEFSSAMAILYRSKLEYDSQYRQGQSLTCTPAYLALMSVTSMVHDIARARLPTTGPGTSPGIISLYHVAKVTSSLHYLRPDSGIVVNDIIDTLRSLSQQSNLASENMLDFSLASDTTELLLFYRGIC